MCENGWQPPGSGGAQRGETCTSGSSMSSEPEWHTEKNLDGYRRRGRVLPAPFMRRVVTLILDMGLLVRSHRDWTSMIELHVVHQPAGLSRSRDTPFQQVCMTIAYLHNPSGSNLNDIARTLNSLYYHGENLDKLTTSLADELITLVKQGILETTNAYRAEPICFTIPGFSPQKTQRSLYVSHDVGTKWGPERKKAVGPSKDKLTGRAKEAYLISQIAKLPGPKNVPHEKPPRPSVNRKEAAMRKEAEEEQTRMTGIRPVPRDTVLLPNAAGQSRPPSPAPSATSTKSRKAATKKRGKRDPSPQPSDSDSENSRPED
ncbi:uncharacterized protein LOC129580883 isoform X5 [Paramacrobiotus metropolitanus]|uniref:uncharacterized protein LOC129580883 isoform X5 n=1 Tax=Paramacrobiotus metropolitanus TaxID=2943436 RepID=UPI0024456F8C|nr:uncharacterized protein LOC129580883 isoform X5 [Paramacrobiotus metropolitanus]